MQALIVARFEIDDSDPDHPSTTLADVQAAIAQTLAAHDGATEAGTWVLHEDSAGFQQINDSVWLQQ